MARITKRHLWILAGGVLVLPILAGCSGQAPPMSKEEQAHFTPKPMPPEAVKGMQEALKQAREKQANANQTPNGNH